MLSRGALDKINVYTYKLAIFTDRVDFINKLNEADIDKLLELRAFDAGGEIRVYRSTVDSDFKTREIVLSDEDDIKKDFENRGFFDETHYLDIDTKIVDESDSSLKRTIGGGIYHLPVNNKMIIVRYYYKYDDNGIANKYDWRLVGFTDTEDKRWQQNKEDE